MRNEEFHHFRINVHGPDMRKEYLGSFITVQPSHIALTMAM